MNVPPVMQLIQLSGVELAIAVSSASNEVTFLPDHSVVCRLWSVTAACVPY